MNTPSKTFDSRTALAILLCIMVVFSYEHLVMAPYRDQYATAHTVNPAVAPIAEGGAANAPVGSAPTLSGSAGAPVVASTAQTVVPSIAEVAGAESVSIRTPNFIARLSSRGGRLTSLQLLNYKEDINPSDRSAPERLVEMVRVQEGMEFPLGVTVDGVADGGVNYTFSASTGVNSAEYALNPGESLTLTLRGVHPHGTVIKKLAFNGHSFAIRTETMVENNTKSNVSLSWTRFISETDAKFAFDPPTVSYLTNESSVKTLPLATPIASQVVPPSRWLAIGSKYFLAALDVPAPAVGAADAAANRSIELSSAAVKDGTGYTLAVKSIGGSQTVVVYGGPRATEALEIAGNSLNRAVDLGYFSFLAAPLLVGMNFFYGIFGNYGLAIILLTLVIKLLFLPLTRKSYESMAAMQEVQPEVAALRERIKDATQLNQEMMALYKRKGVNPLGGCLPVVIQIPVFLGLYNALLQAIELRHEPFALWIRDLSSPERLMLFGLPVPLMILLLGASMFVQQMSQPKTTLDPLQQRIMMLMPVMFTGMFIVFPMPAGLVLYWLVNNLITIVQQVYLKGHRKANPLVATLVASMGIFCIAYVLTLLPF